MFIKYFYLIRHGETILNKERIRQGEKGKLSSKGVNGAIEVGKRLTGRHIQRMFISPYERTLETAKYINQSLQLKDSKQIITPLLAERRNPTNIIGLSYDDPIANSFISKMDNTIHDPNLRIYDEENFQDLKDRAIKTQKYLIKHGRKYNVCITHGIFLKMFISTLLYGKNLTVKDYIQINLFNTTDNTSITLVKYSYLKAFFKPFRKFFNSILGDDDIVLNLDDSRSHIDKYSPWEILIFNEYVPDEEKGGLEKENIYK